MPRLNLNHGQPVPARGGRVLHRALVLAFNRVPGPCGRYAVELVGDEGSLLSERLPGGTYGPLMLVQPGCLFFLHPDGLYSAFRSGEPISGSPTIADLQNGWPFKRFAAIVSMLHDENPGIVWDAERLMARRNSRDRFNIAGQPVNFGDRTRAGCAHSLRLGPDFAGTYCGAGTMGRDRLNRLYRSASYIDEWYSGIRAGLLGLALYNWRRALAVGGARSGGSAPDILAGVGLEPVFWNNTSDPGGDGDPSGPGGDRDGDDYDGDDDDYDGDGDRRPPPARELPRVTQIRDPDLIGSSYRDWDRRSPALTASRIAANVARVRRARLMAELEGSLNATPVPAPAPGCEHCRQGACPDCTNGGACINCGAALPLVTELAMYYAYDTVTGNITVDTDADT